jgi:PAS domain S-box-containing protein
MTDLAATHRSLLTENAELRSRLAEAEEVLRAIRSGDVDALVVEGDTGPRVFTLQGAEATSSRARGEMLENISDAILAVDASGCVEYVNSAAERLFDLKAASVLGRNIFQIDAFTCVSDLFDQGLDNIAEWRGETVCAGRNGANRILEATLTLRRLAGNSGGGRLAILRDITGRKHAEAALRAAHDTFRALVEGSPFGIYVVDADLRIMLVAAGAQKAFETVRPLIGRDFSEAMQILWPESLANEIIAIFRRTLETGQTYHSPRMVEHRQDIAEIEAYDWKIERMTMPDGRYGVVCYFYDLSIRERYEAALRASEERLRVTFENAAVGLAHVGADGSWLRVNAKLCTILGYAPDELLAMTFQDITHPDDIPSDWANAERMLAGEIDNYTMEKRYIRKDASVMWANLTVGCARKPDGALDYFISAVQDITARKLAESRLVESEERLRLATDAAKIGIWMWEPSRDRVVWENHWLYELTGIPKSDAPISEQRFLDEFVHLDDREMWRGEIENVRRHKAPLSSEVRIQRQDGDIRWVQIRGKFADDDGLDEPSCMIGTARDITARKAREQQNQLLMREISHRSKNLLSVVQAVARHTAKSSPNDFVPQFSQRIQSLAASQDLLVHGHWQGAGVADLVRAQLAHLTDLFGTRIELRGEPFQLSAGAAQTIGMVLHELATNAGKYGALSRAKGKITISWDVITLTNCIKLFAMGWVESGGPPVVAPTRRGFGTVVIDAMAKSGLSADVRVDFSPAGFQWHLKCPVDQVQETHDQW